MKNQRPKNLSLLTIRFPLPAIVSILHRISGVILFLLIPLILWGLNLSLTSQESFDDLVQLLSSPIIKWIIFGSLAAFIYHFVAGIRHLLMDMHMGEGLKSGRYSSVITLVISVLLILLVGIWLW